MNSFKRCGPAEGHAKYKSKWQMKTLRAQIRRELSRNEKK